MAKLLSYRIETDQFHFGGGVFTQEVSTLGDDVLRQMRSRIYDDACDEGFTLVSSRTGKEVLMYLDHVGEGDAMFWEFHPVDMNEHSFKKLVIFND